MRGRAGKAAGYLLLTLLGILPLVLISSSIRSFRELDRQRTVYLRTRAAAIASHLETLPLDVSPAVLFESLSEEEPALAALQLFASPQTSPPETAALWSGRELFRTAFLRDTGREVYRAYIPFHSPAGMRLAQIDLDAHGADFLTLHARHNLVFSALSGLVLAALAWYGLWSTRRAAALERRQLELEHLAHLGQMAAALAHEIRNPLGTMKGFAQLAGERAPEEIRKLLEPVVRESQRLERLVSDLMLYGRPPTPAPREVRWEEVECDLGSHARQTIGEHRIRFRTDSSLVVLHTDPELLGQVLLNLVRNAAEAMETGPGEILVEIRPHSDGGIVIRVVDDGPGIPERIRNRLFQPFFTTKASGTGLGLAISRKIATALGGELEIRPNEPHGVEARLHLTRGR